MRLNVADDGSLSFRCHCGHVQDAGPRDVQVAGETRGAEKETQKYGSLIRNAPHDRTTQRVLRACPKCGLDYMTRLTPGAEKMVVFSCKCGHVEC